MNENFEMLMFASFVLIVIVLYALYAKLARLWLDIPDQPFPSVMRMTIFFGALVTAPILVWVLALAAVVVGKL